MRNDDLVLAGKFSDDFADVFGYGFLGICGDFAIFL